MDIAIRLNTNIAQIDTCTDIDNGYQQLLKHNVELPINSEIILTPRNHKKCNKKQFHLLHFVRKKHFKIHTQTLLRNIFVMKWKIERT